MDAQSLAKRLEVYGREYGAYTDDPAAWEAQHGSWVEFEHLEKSKVLHEMGQIMELLHQKTANEGSLKVKGDLEYYSTVKEALAVVREFLTEN